LMRLVRLASLQGHTENSLRLTEQRYRELVDLEARFRATFEHAAVGIAHVAEDGRFQLVNRKLCEMLGYTREELSLLTVFDVSHPEDREVTLDLRRRMRAGEIDAFTVVKRYLRKDRNTLSMEVTASLVRAPNGEPSYEIALFEDISARRAAEEALARSEARFRTVVNSANEGILVYDRSLNVIAGNAAAERIIGAPLSELLGKPGFTSLFPCVHEDGTTLQADERPTKVTTRIGQPLTGKIVGILRPDGAVTWVSVNTAFLRRDEYGEHEGIVSTINDITARLRAEERLQQSVERFEIVARATNDVVWDWNLDTDQIWWNENFRAVFGYQAAEVGAYLDSRISRIHPQDVEAVKRDVESVIERGEKAWSGEYRFRRRDGSYATVLDRGLVIHNSAGKAVRMIGAMMDVSERKEYERRIRLQAERQGGIARLGQFALAAADLEAVFAEAVGVLRSGGCDVAAVLEKVSDEGEFVLRAASGEGAEVSVGRSAVVQPDSKWRTAIASGSTVVSDRAHFQSRSPEGPWSEWMLRMTSGVYVPIQGERGPLGVLSMNSAREKAFDEDDLRFAEAIANVLSGTARRHQTERRLAYLAQFDALTELPNRTLLQDRLTQTLVQSRRRNWQGAVLFIDLDRFKLVNDTLGHHIGDALITEVGRRLKACVRAGDTVGRVSGDEFGIVLADLARADDAALVAQKVLDALARPLDLGGVETYVTASIGISIFPADGDDAETLLKNADMAMYRAKEQTRNAYCFFTAEMNQRSVAKLQLNTDLRRAIERREFVLHYQPKVDLRDNRLIGAEALLRWNHPTRGLISPAEFVPTLEESGLILPVGEWVLGEACTQLARWRDAGRELVPIAVNLSAKQFRRRDLDAVVQRALAAAAVPSHLIELEITESCLMDDPEEAVRLLTSLRAAGLKISVDDFGTGYSSLSYLTRLPLNTLKIDRSFVRDAASNGEAASIVRAVIDMAHNLNFTVIAEGVETAEQVAFLKRHGCDLGQGFLFDRPLPAEELGSRLSRAA
jgi:diguanylate cyclase (GGDEF)-like protein/PAS domain S-box-containing protein